MKPLPTPTRSEPPSRHWLASAINRLGLTERTLPESGFIRDRRTVLVLLGACSLVLLPYTTHLPGWIAGFCAALLSWRAWLTWRQQALPPRWLLLLLSTAGLSGIYLDYGTFIGREAGVAMLVVLLACKLLEIRARRDLFVVIFLSFFLILALFFYSQSILVAFAMLLAMGLMLCVQLSMQFVHALPPLRTRLKLAARIMGLAMPLALVLFLLFPRIEGPLWGQPASSAGAGSGLSDSMSPGDISSLAMSEALAFRVRFLNGLPPAAELYWRGPVLGDFDGRTWRPLRRTSGKRAPLLIETRQSSIHYQVTLEPSQQRHLFALEVPHSLPHLRDNPVWLTADLELLTTRPLRQRVHYQASSSLNAAVQAQADSSDFAPWLLLPPGYNPATRDLAARLRQRTRSNAELVQATLAYFRNEPFHYTLEPPLLGRHTVDEFLFSSRSGFCEHYAGAFVFLMRAAGMPARVITGYQGGEINPVDGQMSVRQSDAHAWAEVWLADQGWLRVDPTAAVAPERVTTQSRAPLPAAEQGTFTNWSGLGTLQHGLGQLWHTPLHLLRQGWEAANAGWDRWVLDYSSDRQQSLLAFFGIETVDWRVLTGLLLGIGGLVSSLVLLPVLRQRRRLPPAEALYQSFCHHLKKLGHPKALHEGPRAYAQRLATDAVRLSPTQQGAAIRFLTLYETMHYAPPEAAPAGAVAQLKSLLQECR